MKGSHVTIIAWSGANPGGRIWLPEREQGRKKNKMYRKKTIATLLSILFLASMLSIVPVNAKAVKVDLSVYKTPLNIVGKVIFGNPMSKSEESSVDWMVTVILQNGAPDSVYLVFPELNYHMTGGKYISIGLMYTDGSGCGAFHYNGDFNDPILGIDGPGTYILGICLNDVTGVTLPEGYEDGIGITSSPGASVYTTYGDVLDDTTCLRSTITLR